MLKRVVILFCLVLWPLNFILNYPKLNFVKDTVFKNDYQGEQLVLRNIQLYPTPLMARIFQNKPRIYLNKYMQNFFTLTDPNYYFFASHPQPIPGNLNLFKYPFMAIIFFLFGIFHLQKSKYKKLILTTLSLSLIFLSALVKFEGYDVILFLPVSLIIINGINILEYERPRFFSYFSFVFLIFALTEIIRSFFNTI